jgi:hypothetical protein
MKGVFLLKTFWGGRLKLDTIINTNFSVNRRALGSSIELTEINYWSPYIYTIAGPKSRKLGKYPNYIQNYTSFFNRNLRISLIKYHEHKAFI